MEKLFGIDISHWQGDMSIEQARNERGVKFAIIKAAGADDGKYKDSKFENYYAQCKAIGLPVGAYYYGNAKSVAEAEQEADHFLSVIAGKQFEYPIYYDVEGKMLNNSRDVLTNIVIAFCDRCEKAGYFVGVYTSDLHFQENMKLYVAMMKKLGLKKAPAEADSEFYTDKWERMESYSLDKEPPKTMKFKDNGEPMFYLERYGTLYVIRKAKKAKKVLTPEEEAKKQNMRNKKQIKAILKEAANTRKVFIEGILSGRIKKVTDEKQVEADLFEQMMDWETFTGHNKLIEFFVGCEVYNAPEEEKEAAHKKMQGLSVLQKLLCLVSAMVADADLVEWNYTYNTVRGEKVKAFYGILEQYGFQFPNDEEKGVVEGTSDLYVKKEGAK